MEVLRRFIEWWAGWPKWLRYAIPGALLLLTGILFLCGVYWPWGLAIGTVLLICADLPDRL